MRIDPNIAFKEKATPATVPAKVYTIVCNECGTIEFKYSWPNAVFKPDDEGCVACGSMDWFLDM
jgi:hypothetical protein